MDITKEDKGRKGRLSSILTEMISTYMVRQMDMTGAVVSVSRIELSPKGTTANVFVSIFPENRKEELFEKLVESTSKIKADLANNSKLRRIPTLYFNLDETAELIDKIDQAQK